MVAEIGGAVKTLIPSEVGWEVMMNVNPQGERN